MKRVIFTLLMGAVVLSVSFNFLLAGEAKKPLKIAMVTPYPLGRPFTNLCYQGLEDAKRDFGDQIKLVEAPREVEYPIQIRGMAEIGYDVIIGLHEMLAPYMIRIAPEFPKKKFIIVDSYQTAPIPNLKTIPIEPQEGCFVAGVIAAHATRTNHVGFIGGLDHPIIIQFLAGFEAGLKYVNPDIKISVAFSGTFGDPAKGREMALAMFDKGVDVIMHACDKTGLGVLKAAAEVGNYGIGVDMDQSNVAPGYVLVSALKDARGAVYHAIKEIHEDRFKSGLCVFGVKEGAKLVAIPKEIDFYQRHPEVLREVEVVLEKIKEGKIVVPKTTTTR